MESENVYAAHGLSVERIPSEWRFASHNDLEAVIRLEFSEDVAARILQQHTGTRMSYHYLLMYRRY